MVTGMVPFEAKDAKAVMLKHLKQKPDPPNRWNLDLSFGLNKAILQMMAKKKENRYDSTRTLIEELQSIEFLLEVDDRPAPIPTVEKHQEPVKLESIDKDEDEKPAATTTTTIVRPKPKRNPVNIFLVLALAVSILMNLVLLLVMTQSR
jgi:serine/threonine protein kinase